MPLSLSLSLLSSSSSLCSKWFAVLLGNVVPLNYFFVFLVLLFRGALSIKVPLLVSNIMEWRRRKKNLLKFHLTLSFLEIVFLFVKLIIDWQSEDHVIDWRKARTGANFLNQYAQLWWQTGRFFAQGTRRSATRAGSQWTSHYRITSDYGIIGSMASTQRGMISTHDAAQWCRHGTVSILDQIGMRVRGRGGTFSCWHPDLTLSCQNLTLYNVFFFEFRLGLFLMQTV